MENAKPPYADLCKNQARDEVVVLVETMPPDEDNTIRAYRINIDLYSNRMDEYSKNDNVIDYDNEAIMEPADMLFQRANNELEFIRITYEFIRDNISHSADINKDVITCAVSEVLKAGVNAQFSVETEQLAFTVRPEM